MAETIVWIDPDGASTTLHNTTTYFVSWNVQSRFSPPVRFEEDGVPGSPGLRLRSVLHGVREIALPVWVTGVSEADLRTKIRELTSAMNPLRGDGKLRVTSPLSDQREITCRIASGLDGTERIGDTAGALSQLFPLVLRAHDPFWTDVSDTVTDWQINQAPGSWFPIFPLRLSSSEVFANDTITNSGDAECWPVWSITGPGSSIILMNLTTDSRLTLNVTLGASESVEIDTRPGYKTVTKSDGSNQFSSLTSTSSLWSLERGANAIQVQMGGATTDSRVQLRRRHRYLAV